MKVESVASSSKVKAHPAFAEAIAVLDESATEKAGEVSMGAGRQHNGRLSEICQYEIFRVRGVKTVHLYL
jgi:hypothetical protein